ncbi:MAG: chromosomal replication initiator DnaA [Xanthobacteraceae bacterium]|nr:chromosomal replication initiator DnaA [Xanthobacteraceae bacterium]QYK46015.1 MAG: chromosomal replication initiator DnaA [Xanthobacteraceae bacterium]
MRGAAARQLPLDLPHEVSFRRDDFLESPANAEALALVERWPEWPTHGAVIVGPHGSGKSHLASIWAERAGARVLPLRMLSRAEAAAALSTGAAVLENLVPGEYDEAALFHLLNMAREDAAHVLITSEHSPDHGAAALPDLASRLRALPKAILSAPDDELIAAVLVKLFADRQIAIEPDVIAYLLPRMERSLGSARELVARVDAAALAAGKPATRAFVSALLRQ